VDSENEQVLYEELNFIERKSKENIA